MPKPNELWVLTDEELLTIIKRWVPLVSDEILRGHLRVFRSICSGSNVVVLSATPKDAATIRERVAIGWSDDRP